MEFLKDISVTSINCPALIRSNKGENFQMINREFYGLSFCISGQITYTMNGKSFVSTPESAIFLPKGASYTLIRDQDGLFPLINFDCNEFLLDEIATIPLKNPSNYIHLFNTLQRMFLQNDSRLKILSCFYYLLNNLFEENLFKPSVLEAATEFICNNLSDASLTNTTVANHLNISEIYLRKLFNKHYKTTPKQYLIDKRIQKASHLLINTQLKVTAISEECGFSSLYHFCRMFKEKTGLTPTQYALKNSIFNI